MQKFITAVTLLLPAAASKVSASPIFARQATTDCNITTFQLTANLPYTPPYSDVMYQQLLYANNSVFIGQARYELTSEPLIISAESSFLSIHQAPTGSQFAFVYPGETAPLQYSVAHGPIVPDGASQLGFNFTGTLWGVNGTTNKWVACPTAFSEDGNWTIAQIYYQDGAVNKSCAPVNLTQFIYGNPGSNSNF